MILACHDVSKAFGEHVIIQNGSFHIEPGMALTVFPHKEDTCSGVILTKFESFE